MLALLVVVALGQDAARGEILAGLSGCVACHTAPEGAPLAGGFEITTRFGVFHGSNLTPDPEHGLGAWSFEDFERAMQEGRSPEGRAYWPAFPYTAFTRLTETDLADLWAWLQAQPAVPQPDVPHAVLPRFDSPSLLGTWRSFAFRPGVYEPDPRRDAVWNRGAYLGTGPGHCGECHSPRSGIGIPRRGRALAGSDDPPEPAPNLTPHPDGLGAWDEADLVDFLSSGMTPEGDFVGGHMARIIELGTARLPEEDRVALAAWLRSLPARPSR